MQQFFISYIDIFFIKIEYFFDNKLFLKTVPLRGHVISTTVTAGCMAPNPSIYKVKYTVRMHFKILPAMYIYQCIYIYNSFVTYIYVYIYISLLNAKDSDSETGFEVLIMF